MSVFWKHTVCLQIELQLNFKLCLDITYFQNLSFQIGGTGSLYTGATYTQTFTVNVLLNQSNLPLVDISGCKRQDHSWWTGTWNHLWHNQDNAPPFLVSRRLWQFVMNHNFLYSNLLEVHQRSNCGGVVEIHLDSPLWVYPIEGIKQVAWKVT